MGILTNSGKVAMAESLMARPIHMAWGTGDEAWDTTAVEPSITDVALLHEVGRRVHTVKSFCTPDDAGEIVIPTGRFAFSAQPTNHLYFKFNFDFTDAPTSHIREAAVFVGTETNADLPSGQKYFLPSDLTNVGRLVVVERFPGFARSPSVRQSFEFVVIT